MKKLDEKFILKHINEYFLLGINSLYWKGTEKSSISFILKNYPSYSKSFYKKYGNFFPCSTNTILHYIKTKNVSINFLNTTILWDDFIIDIISFFRLSNASSQTLNIIIDSFKHYFKTVNNFTLERMNYAKKLFDNGNDKLLILLEFKSILDLNKNSTGFELAAYLGPYSSIDCNESSSSEYQSNSE
jgi:hypothetical protein